MVDLGIGEFKKMIERDLGVFPARVLEWVIYFAVLGWAGNSILTYVLSPLWQSLGAFLASPNLWTGFRILSSFGWIIVVLFVVINIMSAFDLRWRIRLAEQAKQEAEALIEGASKSVEDSEKVLKESTRLLRQTRKTRT